MKNIGPILAGGLTLIIVLMVGVFSFLPNASGNTTQSAPAGGPIVVPAVDTAPIQATLTERETVYQNQIQELDTVRQQRNGTYNAQIQTLSSQILAAQNQLAELKTQEEALSGQISQLESTRAERLASYESQLSQLNNQYSQRLPQLQNQLAEAQASLAQAQTQLNQ